MLCNGLKIIIGYNPFKLQANIIELFYERFIVKVLRVTIELLHHSIQVRSLASIVELHLIGQILRLQSAL